MAHKLLLALSPIPRDIGNKAAQLQDVQYYPRRRILVAPWQMYQEAQTTPQPKTTGDADWAFHQAVNEPHGIPRVANRLMIKAEESAESASSQTRRPHRATDTHPVERAIPLAILRFAVWLISAVCAFVFSSSVTLIRGLVSMLGRSWQRVTGK